MILGAIRKIALLIALPLALMGANAAPAAAASLFAEEFAAEIKGEATETQTLGAGALKIECEKATSSGELVEPSEQLTLASTYTECSATLEMNGCTQVLHVGSESSENVFGGTLDIACPKEHSIKIVALGGKCEAKIGAQSGLSSVTFEDKLEPQPSTVTLKDNLSGIHYTVTKDEGICPFPGTGEKTNGTLTGNSSLKAYSEGEQEPMAAQKEGNAKLCSQAPGAGNVCPAGKVYEKGTTIQAVENGATAALIALYEGARSEIIWCEQSVIFGNSGQEVGTPRLMVEKLNISFGACVDALGKGKSCEVEMTNAPTTASIGIGLKAGWGILYVAMTISVRCGPKAEVDCEFGTARENFRIFPQSGLLAEDARVIGKIGGAACVYDRMVWVGGGALLEPLPMYVTL